MLLRIQRSGLVARAFLMILMTVLALAACRSDDPSPEEAKAQLCTDLEVMNNEVTALKSLAPSDTVGELRDARDDVKDAYDDVENAAEDYDEAVIDELKDAEDNLEKAIDDLPDSMSLEEASASIADETEAVQSAVDQMNEDVDCGLRAEGTTTAQATAPMTPSAAAAEATATAPPTATLEPTATTVPPTETPAPTPTSEPPTPTLEPTATTAPPTATQLPQPAQATLVYEANWSQGQGDWMLPDGWAITDGKLTVDGQSPGAVPAPYLPTKSDYVVEATLSVTGGPLSCQQTVGIFARSVTREGETEPYPVGLIAGVCPQRWSLSSVEDEAATPQTLADGDFSPGSSEHVYRFEVSGSTVRLFIDGTFAGEATNVQLTDAGSAGIFVGGDYQITVSTFKIFEF